MLNGLLSKVVTKATLVTAGILLVEHVAIPLLQEWVQEQKNPKKDAAGS